MTNFLRIILCLMTFAAFTNSSNAQQRPFRTPGMQDTLLLKNYRPKSIFVVPQTEVLKAKYPAIDIHMHTPRGEDLNAVARELLARKDEVGVEKTILFAGTGELFERNMAAFGKYPDRFELWCGLDLSGYDKPGFSARVIADLERYVALGARGVGEVHDKGAGLRGTTMHPNDPRMDPIFKKMAELRLPVNLHIGDPVWMYEPMDVHNDLLWEAFHFRLDNQDVLHLDDMIGILEETLARHPDLIVITPHFANLTYDLARLGRLFDKYPNLYADVSQREAYVATIPRFARDFMEKYADRLLWGTDQGFSLNMYRTSFRIWETLDDHFYAWDVSNSPWVLHGLGLSDETLRKMYRDNALKLLNRK
jgi:uncharacterized protein